ncbi:MULTISPECIES: pilus assembly protein TadG-related protein [unclassified Streptomyces]|uniref:pilus assembly protein TadG-related protein n=1 Tax=unclassified Streptomyces TaxID=2593676 RepID=UPI000FFEA638|nr:MULTISPECIES: pilus assembly protein TadG-related protein [unclassified Streptomyces]
MSEFVSLVSAGERARDHVRTWLSSRRAHLDDRGSGAGAVIIFAIVFLSLSAFVIDGGMSISKRERAADIAEQAARYAAQDIDRDALYENAGAAPINYQDCDARVKTFARQMDMSGADIAATHCVTADAQQVQVEVQLTYAPVFTGMFYGGDVVVHGQAVAENEVG